MTSQIQRHLVTVWNPAYAANAIEEHIRVLLHWARALDQGDAADDAVYVWWGKVKSPNRQAPQRHQDDVAAIGRELDADEDESREVQLYLTDYRSLYVADLAQVHVGPLPEAEQAHVPPYYREQGLTCDFWFQLNDIRRLVVDDTVATIEELRALRNVHYNDRPVSLYGGMVDLPLIVTRPDGRRHFTGDERDALTGGALWVEFDAEQGVGVGPIMRSLRDDRFGEAAWAALDVAARTFIATGERLYRDNRDDPAFDFAPVIGSFAKALEVQVNQVLRDAVPHLTAEQRRMNIDGRTVELGAESTRASLGQLARAISGEKALFDGLARVLENGAWFTQSLPAIIGDFARHVRNPGTHSEAVDRKTATYWRNRLIGVGEAGVFLELAGVGVRRQA